jgi:MFS family permease
MGARDPFQEFRAGYRLLKQVPGFRQFIITRGLLVSIELSLPFYTLYARQASGGSAGDLGVFVIAASLSQVLSSPFWGKLADRTSRWTMMLSAGLAGTAGILMLGLDWIPAIPSNAYILAIPVMIIGFAIAGARLGRKTYLVDGAPDEKRPLYAALTNTIAGGLIILGGGLGFVADRFGIQVLMIILVALAFVSAASSYRLPTAENLEK